MSYKKVQPNLNEFFDMKDSITSRNLRGFLYRNVVGSNADYRTPLWDEAPRDEILSKWDVIFSDWAQTADSKLFESLFQFEADMKAKVGPYSIMAPLNDRMEGIEEYFTLVDGNVTIDGGLLSQAMEEVLREFTPVRGIRLRSRRNVALNMKLSTNSGSPFFKKRKRVVEKTLAGQANGYKMVAVLGWRGQEGGPAPEDVKQRAVFMMPLELNIEELRAYQPLIEAVQKHKLIPAYVSSDCVEARITKLFDSKDPEDLVVATDFSKFDHHFNRRMQNVSQHILNWLLSAGADMESRNWIENIFPIKFQIPLLVSKDVMIKGDHGMGSGSGGTNFDETLAHRTLQYAAALNQNKELNPNSQCLGDDGILTYPGISVDDVVQVYASMGQDMNPEKQYAAKNNTVYLRRWYHSDYRKDGICKGVYSTYRALGRLMGQERFYDPKLWGPEMVVLRSLSILENCSEHPLFTKLVDFVIEGDKYKLGLEIPGFFTQINSVYAEAKAKLPSFGSYTQDIQNQKGIQEWAVVKYLWSKKK